MSLLVLVACAHCNSWGFALGHPPLSYCPLCYSSLLSWGSLAPEGVQPREVKTPGLLLFNSFITSTFFKLTHRSSREFTQFSPGATEALTLLHFFVLHLPCYISLHCTCTGALQIFALHTAQLSTETSALCTDSLSHSAQYVKGAH